MSKKTNKRIIIGILILALIAGGVAYANKGTGSLALALSGEKYIEAPEYGWLKCEEGAERASGYQVIPGSWKTVDASNLGTVQSFDVRVSVVPKTGEVAANSEQICYNLCDPYCKANYTCEPYKYAAVVSQSPYEKIFHIPANGKLLLKHQYKSWVFGSWQDSSTGDGVNYGYKVSFTPYRLVAYSVRQPVKILTEQNCMIGSSQNLSTGDMIKSATTSVLNGGAQYWNGNAVMRPNDIYSYLYGYSPVPAPTIGTYNGQDVFCSGNILRPIASIVTGSYTYNVVDMNSVVAQVPCCDGLDQKPGYTCQGYKWIPSAEAQCSTWKPCANPCPNYEIDYSDLAYKTLFCQKCVDSACVTETKQVDCASDLACPSNKVCRANQCIDPGTVPIPPIIPPPPCTGDSCGGSETPWGWIAVISGLAVLGLLVGLKASHRDKWLGAMIGTMVGGELGGVLYWLRTLAWWQYALIGVGVLVVLVFVLARAYSGTIGRIIERRF